MVFFRNLLGNYILICAAIGYFSAQLLKFIIFLLRGERLSFSLLVASGGLPSSHASTVCALTSAIGKAEGVHSSFFAISFVVAAIVMYDAMGVRRETGEQAKLLNILIDDLHQKHDIRVAGRHFKELVGHTPIQVMTGAVLGAMIPFIYTGGI